MTKTQPTRRRVDASRNQRDHGTRPSRRSGGSGNTPYVNPDRDAKSLKAGRLRKELLP